MRLLRRRTFLSCWKWLVRSLLERGWEGRRKRTELGAYIVMFTGIDAQVTSVVFELR